MFKQTHNKELTNYLLSEQDKIYRLAYSYTQNEQDALNRLPADLKTIVVLRYLHEFQLQEVADVLSINLNTVKTRLYRALRLLKIEMEEEHV